jgi:PAS domain S-box-containing protein
MDFTGKTREDLIRELISLRKDNEVFRREQFLFSSLMDNIKDAVYFKDHESRFLRINRMHIEKFGITDPSEAIGKTDFDFFTEEHASLSFQDEQKIMNTGESLVKEEKETQPGKSDRWVSTVKMPLYDGEGKIIGTFGISRDITEKKYYEERINILANALRSINECVSITDMKDKVLFLNEAFTRVYGYTEEDLKLESITKIRSINNPEELVKNILPDTIRGGWHGELLNFRKDGSEFPVSLSTSVVKNENGEPVALIGVANDITEKRRIELEKEVINAIIRGVTTTADLEEFMKLVHVSLSKIVTTENIVIALYDFEKSQFTFPYFIDKYDDIPLPSTMDRSCTSYIFRTGNALVFTQEVFGRLIREKEVEEVGKPSPSWVGIPLKTPSKIIGVLVLQDYEHENVYTDKDVEFLESVGGQIAVAIERKQSEEAIKTKNELLQVSNAEKDKFFSIIAHDLRGPLGSFVQATKLMTDRSGMMTMDEITGLAETMRVEAASIYGLLENLLEWSRFTRGMIGFNPVKLNLREKITSTTELFSEIAARKNIQIFNNIKPEFGISADENMLGTILRNLLSNALKFTPNGGIVKLSATESDTNNIEISVCDTGIGIDDNLKQKLFKLTEKTNRPGTEGESSSGLGLHLCKEFIEKHGCEIYVESETGKGSCFTFTMKRA